METGIQENSNYLTRLFIFQLSIYLDETILSLIMFHHVGETEKRCPEEPGPDYHTDDLALRKNWGHPQFSS